MSTKSRQTVYGGQMIGAKIRAESARKRAVEATREADRAEARCVVDPDGSLWRSGAAIPNHRPVSQRRYGWLEVECYRCKTRASIPLDAIRSPRHTPIWKLEAALKCRSCRTPRYSPPVHMIKLTETREITSYVWVHPDDDR
jgi:hypothetical protein